MIQHQKIRYTIVTLLLMNLVTLICYPISAARANLDYSGITTRALTEGGVYSQSGGTVSKSDTSYTSTTKDESAVKVINSGDFTLADSTITKSGDTSSMDNSSFYGLNAGVLATTASKIRLSNITITTTGTGANGVFATGAGSTIDMDNVTINCTASGAHGVDATLEGVLKMNNVNITTAGDGAAGAIATDRGGGTIDVTGGVVNTSGFNSPGIYSTGEITVTGGTFTSTGAEAAVVEGNNSISLTNTTLSCSKKWGVIIYQSMSGDAEEGTGNFTMEGGSLSASTGPLFYITNTDAVISLEGTALSAASGTFLKASAGDWGTDGANGGTVTLTADSQSIQGDLICDNISSVDMTLKNGSTLTSAINTANSAQALALTLDSTSAWSVNGTSYLTSLTDEDTTLANLDDNGNTIYYDSSAAASAWLDGETYKLTDGGTLTPISGSTGSEPTLTKISPASGTKGATLTGAVITGGNLTGASSVTFSGTGVTADNVTVVSDTEITATITISSTAAAGSRDVTVTVDGGMSAVLTGGFTVKAKKSSGGGGGGGGGNGGTTRPEIKSVFPPGGSADAALDSVVKAVFSMSMNPDTITTSSFLLTKGTTAIAGIVSYLSDNKTAVFIPNDILDNNTVYQATITTAARNTSGRGLYCNYSWTFTTADTPVPVLTPLPIPEPSPAPAPETMPTPTAVATETQASSVMPASTTVAALIPVIQTADSTASDPSTTIPAATTSQPAREDSGHWLVPGLIFAAVVVAAGISVPVIRKIRK